MNTTQVAAGADMLVDSTLGSIARQIPGSTEVLRRHKLDFCCGGDATLASAAQARGDDAARIASELRALVPQPAEAPEEPDALIDHILARYHDVHRRELPELLRLAERVEQRHAGNRSVPAGLRAALQEAAAALEEHMAKEEQILFPMMMQGGHPMIAAPIGRMRVEHVEHGERLRQLEAMTHDHTPPPDACTSWQALYAGTRKLVDDVMQHIHLENNVLFPQFGAGCH